MKAPLLSLVVPAYNEAGRIQETIRALSRFLRDRPETAEVVLAIEKSGDGTLELAARAAGSDPAFRLVALPAHRGKGYAVREGVLAAAGRYVFFMDADLSTSLRGVRAFLDRFEASPRADVLVGSRRHAGARILRRQPFTRRVVSRLFNAAAQRLAVAGIADTQCGFKAFRREAIRPIFSRQRIDGFAFDVEVLLLAAELGFAVGVLPVEWTDSPSSKVHVRPGVRAFLDLLRLWPRRRSLEPC